MVVVAMTPFIIIEALLTCLNISLEVPHLPHFERVSIIYMLFGIYALDTKQQTGGH